MCDIPHLVPPMEAFACLISDKCRYRHFGSHQTPVSAFRRVPACHDTLAGPTFAPVQWECWFPVPGELSVTPRRGSGRAGGFVVRLRGHRHDSIRLPPMR